MMSWNPPRGTVRYEPDHRLDRYRERGGVLRGADGSVVGELYLQVEQQTEVVGGVLWWRRWGPWLDALRWFTWRVDGGLDEEGTSMFDNYEALLQYLNDDEWPTFDDDTLPIEWLDDAASEKLRAKVGLPRQPDLDSPAQNVRFFRHANSGMFRYPLPEDAQQ